MQGQMAAATYGPPEQLIYHSIIRRV